ncbi:MAG: hypothetical protein ABJ246_18525 [Paracoccaceae bacterium]
MGRGAGGGGVAKRMDERHKLQAKALREMGSGSATDWLIVKFESEEQWNIIWLFLQANLTKKDVRKVATCTMKNNRAHASSGFYRAYISRMGALDFLKFLEGIPPTSARDRSLMHYLLSPIYRSIESPKVTAAWTDFEEYLLDPDLNVKEPNT